MIPVLSPWLILKFGQRGAALIKYGLFAAIAAFALWRIHHAIYQSGVAHERGEWHQAVDRVRNARAAAAIAAARADAARALSAQSAIIANRKDLDHATSPLPDRPLSDRQRARADRELRR